LLNSVVKIVRNSFSTDVADAVALLDTEEFEELPLVGGDEPTEDMEAPSLFGLSEKEGRSAL
jgi:hypothetical protein